MKLTGKERKFRSSVLRQKEGKLVAVGTHHCGSQKDETNFTTAIGSQADTNIRYENYEKFFRVVDQWLPGLERGPQDIAIEGDAFSVKKSSTKKSTKQPQSSRK
jgi:hypothetical protein